MAEGLGELRDLIRIARFILTNDPALSQAKSLTVKIVQAYLLSRDIPPRYLRTVAARCRQLADALDEEAVGLAVSLVENRCKERLMTINDDCEWEELNDWIGAHGYTLCLEHGEEMPGWLTAMWEFLGYANGEEVWLEL